MRRLGAVALLTLGCVFDPNVPSARVLCRLPSDCPAGLSCETVEGIAEPVGVCCREKACAQKLTPEQRQQIELALQGGDAGADAPGESSGSCGNKHVDQGETCDPPSSCPTSCPPMGCETFRLVGSAASCNARCEATGSQSSCTSGDKCCPMGCTAAKDMDCNCTCGDGIVDSNCGETCDPASTCPAACPPRGCMLRRMSEAATCRATCVDDRPQTSCVNGDDCCPPGCNANNDSDCAPACGNAAVERNETCDPTADCPTSCPALGCTPRKLEGSATACNARCVDLPKLTKCEPGDKCCPMGCTTANDADCSCTCGNGVIEKICDETCDPLASCPTACPPLGCQLRRLVNGGTCQAQCVDDMLQTACRGGDSCCPPGCNALNDSDCNARCGNAAVESGETCDPPSSCPAACPWQGCARRKLEGSAMACTVRCADDGTQTACAHGDGCCPPSCNSGNDNDCAPRCGNGVVEGSEKCDGNCPASCPAMGCQRRKLQGDAAHCNAECVNDTVITGCQAGDACCPGGCTTVNDGDCSCRCGNGVVEPACGEKCEGQSCPTSCPPQGCQLRMLEGTGCAAQCVSAGMRTTCADGDSCCPPGCNANNDDDCSPVCGNGVREGAETCDPPSACQTQFDMCVSDASTIRTRMGTVATCTFVCKSMPRACGATADSFCPPTCTSCGATCAAGQDIDCKLASGAVCTHANQCATACVDGRCCGVASCPACQWCRGANGTCAFIQRYTEDLEPPNACSGALSCDGSGHCREDNGSACATAAECASGQCVDGRCCDNACSGVCLSCNLAPAGVCKPIPSGPDSTGSPVCMGSLTCVNGACKTVDGSACAANTDCASGTCTTFFRDADNDGQGGSVTAKFCGTIAPIGNRTNSDDCCDNDPQAFKGQTMFFDHSNICGSFDYNCNLTIEVGAPEFNQCGTATCTPSWAGTAAPACGLTATWQICHRTGPGAGFCDQIVEQRKQFCR
jgi:hypothetical protein